MKQSREAYNELSPERFTVESLEMGSQILLNNPNSLFSKPIPHSYLSSKELPDRLQNPNNWVQLPFPFVFTPSRKHCLRMLLPLPQENTNIIEGFSQVGKSNLVAHLCLMYRCSKKCAVIYIGSLRQFEINPIGYLTTELYYWFFEEINENPIVVTLLQNFMDPSRSKFSQTIKWQQLQNIMSKLATDCKRKGKDIILIWDSYNKKKESELVNEIEQWFDINCSKQIFVTTNKDTNKSIEMMKSEDISSRTIISLDETKNPIPEEELEKLTRELFAINGNDLYASLIVSIFQGNLSLIFLFSKYCLSAGIKFANQDELFNYHEEFKEDYQMTCLSMIGYKKTISFKIIIRSNNAWI